MRDLGKVRKSSENNSPRVFYEFGPFRADPLKRVLRRDGRPVELTGKAFDVLLVLIQSGGEILTKDAIIQRVWPETAVEEGNLSRNISTLRKALGETPEDRQYIVTLAGRGYRFVGEVRERRLGDGGDRELGPTRAPLETAPPQAKLTPLEGTITPFPAAPRPTSQSGLQERLRPLRAGLALAAGGILVLAPLLIWSLRSWRGGLLRSQSARAIGREIAPKLDPSAAERVARPSPVNPEVYDLYFKGRYSWNQRTPDGLHTAATYFKQAIDLDPDYAPAYAGLADAYLLIALDYVPPSDFLARAEAAANKAVALDDHSAEIGRAHV
jgi:DNA-binding winged helix-turn-helix (wHTH) protein